MAAEWATAAAAMEARREAARAAAAAVMEAAQVRAVGAIDEAWGVAAGVVLPMVAVVTKAGSGEAVAARQGAAKA